ncbi:MAG: Tyrosine recombinase xerD [candidate division WWE3 bacterium GW2011_GWF2_41_45]|uniref:Tyrosine recombinase XerC n=2 Tax=Katanobacteria TaxID=422282 RepID=A0A1F4W280_UNCKA|nr:MAG: Tyrosine recombinase xerD [candidate division WWE3 bacterium GW2011_GWC2_41_23]KKS10513.1 MAG: Tyrosine recombinase xerD [candidate division WWE3 bacterium GW2011_GWF2_41_45]KKS20292.1 MAG: Tyrosine recombinase xerD [candidate division WWE3 bacterium GW2011_GWE1_41_72]KKS30294.1 MAG: Tyrosine recombinase xerD [candidate division WWE3 bacterium GW2011_GWD2_42_11]KKS51048.1 MAG: Tyrosine recombinase xerD [candidate division WWE3 bacterium GW2011_GWE2_42_25]KKS60505.1 MAG: Tyrosine recomb
MTKVSLDSNLSDVITQYLEYCEIEKNLSQNTLKMYHFYLTDFLEWLGAFLKIDKITLAEITDDNIKKYRLDLNRRISRKSNMEFKRSTQKTFLVAIRALLKYLVVETEVEIMSPEQIILGKSDDRVPKVLNEEQMKRLFDGQDLSKRSGIRDRAILETLYSTGLRVSELTKLNRDDVNLISGEFTVIGKGRKARTVYLSPAAKDWIKRYLGIRGDSFKPLFLRYSGKHMESDDFDGESLRLTVRSVERMIKKYVTNSGISVDATPHTLRHTYATGLLQEGADLRSVQELLGHSNVSTTQIYTHITNRQLKNIHKLYHKDIDGKPASYAKDNEEDVSDDDAGITSLS